MRDILVFMNNEIIIFSDGSSRGNPGPGGFAAIIIYDKDKVKEIGGRDEDTTNNRMELMGVISALEEVGKSKEKILLYTDSSYVLKGATSWLFGWKKNNWQTKTKTDVLNKDLWIRLGVVMEGKNIEWKLVPGHAGMPLNERCDVIATSYADGKTIDLYNGSAEAYEVALEIEVDDALLAEKSRKKARSSAKAYSYVSMIDGVTMVHHNWAECETRVKGKSGAKFKKVFSAEEERGLIKEWSAK